MTSAKQFLLFCVVGVITTVIDFALFNLLTGRAFRWRRIPANILSVGVAMTWSFLANWLLVFRPEGSAWLERAGRFVVTTAFSAFVLQNTILYLTTYVWNGPVNLALTVVRKLPVERRFNEDMISRNTCKVLAVSVGVIWNFCFYKFFVYRN